MRGLSRRAVSHRICSLGSLPDRGTQGVARRKLKWPDARTASNATGDFQSSTLGVPHAEASSKKSRTRSPCTGWNVYLLPPAHGQGRDRRAPGRSNGWRWEHPRQHRGRVQALQCWAACSLSRWSARPADLPGLRLADAGRRAVAYGAPMKKPPRGRLRKQCGYNRPWSSMTSVLPVCRWT